MTIRSGLESVHEGDPPQLFWGAFCDLTHGVTKTVSAPRDEVTAANNRDLNALCDLAQCTTAQGPAICFYAGRIVERTVTMRTTLLDAWKDQLRNPNLDLKIDWALQRAEVDEVTATALHVIRRLANKVRHHGEDPSAFQVAFCLSMLRQALPWIYLPSRLEVQAACDVHVVTDLDREMQWLLHPKTFSDLTLTSQQLLAEAPRLLSDVTSPKARIPTDLTNWVIQHCIDASRFDLAGDLITPFLIGGDADLPRLEEAKDGWRISPFNRLVALRLSRMGKAEQVVAFLIPQAKRSGYLKGGSTILPTGQADSHAYAESIGILAGALKSLWIAERDPAKLALMKHLYDYVYAAQRWNFYHAINSAACSAWSGDLGASKSTASALIAQLGSRDRAATPWLVLTEAEALILAGQTEKALERYQYAASLFSESHPGALVRAHVQLTIHSEFGLISKEVLSIAAKIMCVSKAG